MSDPVLLHDPREDDLDDLVQSNGDAHVNATTPVLDALKAARARHAGERTYDAVVPGWLDLLVLRLGPISGQQQERLFDRPGRVRSATVNAGILVAAFRGAYGRTTPTGDLELIVDEDGDPCLLDQRLADRLDLGEVHSAREMLERLFSSANSPSLAIAGIANEYGEWARGAGDEIDDEFVGE